MFSLKSTVFLLAVISFGSATVDSEVLKINPAKTGDYELQVVRNGSVTTIIYQNDVSGIFAEEGYEAFKPAGTDECHVMLINKTQFHDEGQNCYNGSTMAVYEVPATVAAFCRGRTPYAVEPVACEERIRRKKRCIYCSHAYTCYNCFGGFCCRLVHSCYNYC